MPCNNNNTSVLQNFQFPLPSKPPIVPNAKTVSFALERNDNVRKVVQIIPWVVEGVYILWGSFYFLMPLEICAISSETVYSLIGLSLNFFFILPFIDSDMSFWNSLLIASKMNKYMLSIF